MAETLVRAGHEAASVSSANRDLNGASPKTLIEQGKMGKLSTVTRQTARTAGRLVVPARQEIAHFGQHASNETATINARSSSDRGELKRLDWIYSPTDFDSNVGRLRPGGPPSLPPPDEPLHDGEPGSPRDHARRVLLSSLGGRPADSAYVSGLIDMIDTRSIQLFLETRQAIRVKEEYRKRLRNLSDKKSQHRDMFPGYREGALAFEEIFEAYTETGPFYTTSGRPDEEHFEKQMNGLNLLRDDYYNLGMQDIIASNGRRYRVIVGFVPARTDGQLGELEGISIQKQRHTLWCGYANVSAMIQNHGYKDQTQEEIFRGMQAPDPYFFEQEDSQTLRHQSPAYGFFAKYGQDLSNGKLKADLHSYTTMTTFLTNHPGHSPREFIDLYLEGLHLPVMIRIPTHNLLVVGVNHDAEKPYYTVINPLVGARMTFSPKELLRQWAAPDKSDYPYDGRYQMLAFRPRDRTKSV